MILADFFQTSAFSWFSSASRSLSSSPLSYLESSRAAHLFLEELPHLLHPESFGSYWNPRSTFIAGRSFSFLSLCFFSCVARFSLSLVSFVGPFQDFAVPP